MTATTISTPQAAPAAAPMPKLWAKFSVRAGTVIQAAGIAAGAAALGTAARLHEAGGFRLALLAAGWLAIYLSSHAIAHVAVGRAAGIRFRAYGVRGTDHPENYPPGVRQLMGVLPMWSALTDKASMRQAGRWAKAAMFAAGETSTTVVSIAAAAYAARAGIPGGHALLAGSILWAIAATITTAIVPKGDYAKALRALGWRKPAAPKQVQVTRQRTTGPDRRGPRRHELRNAVAGWSLVNLALIAAWAATGAGFPWFAIILVPSAIGVGSWARQGRREGRRLRTSVGWLAVARAGAVPCRAAGEVGAHRKEVIPGRTRPGQVMQALYYDRDARPVSWQRWRQLGRQPGYSRAGYAGAVRRGRQVTVITFWSGIAADCGPAGPLIFCTCTGIRDPASPGPAYQRQWRWPTLAAAGAGHQAVTGWMAELAAFLAEHASQLAAPDPDLPGPPPSCMGQGW